ncbi:MAG: DUF1761 domain-containing protein [Bacteroidetes bacterium]|jgi:hypothetical protein|nr:DUF1761 domain-containing protein [Bacteroidota bacterium]
MPLHINIIAILVAMVANFIIQMVWYTALFSKSWSKEMGYDPNMRPDKKAMFKGIALSLVGSLLFAWVLAFYLAGWKFIPGANEMTPVMTGFNSALSVCMGFFIPVQLSRVVWEKHSWKLFFINVGYHIVSTVVVALILSLMA